MSPHLPKQQPEQDYPYAVAAPEMEVLEVVRLAHLANFRLAIEHRADAFHIVLTDTERGSAIKGSGQTFEEAMARASRPRRSGSLTWRSHCCPWRPDPHHRSFVSNAMTNVVTLSDHRTARAQMRSLAQDTAQRLISNSTSYGRMLAHDAVEQTRNITAPDQERALKLTIERFFLRRGLTRSRHAWRKEYGRALGLTYAKMAAPIVRSAFWGALDEIDPITCQDGGRTVPLIRGWRSATR